MVQPGTIDLPVAAIKGACFPSVGEDPGGAVRQHGEGKGDGGEISVQRATYRSRRVELVEQLCPTPEDKRGVLTA